MNFVMQPKSVSWRHGVAPKFPAPADFVEIKDGSNRAPLCVLQDLGQSRRINFDPKLCARLQTLSERPNQGTPDEVSVFDYICGILHCPTSRASHDEFRDASAKGTRLRKLHLIDPATVG
ncbi:MAG: hypothetical protein JNN02_05795, partial [Tabrizicola sp.]|nr:hypothetical protein [Tabrizicola sp.]